METKLELYEQHMSGVRARIDAHSGVRGLLRTGIPPELLHRFLIEYCSLGVQMTAPVEGWIKRAGLRCREIGLTKVGDRLVKHAEHEAGHDRLFVDDTRSLVAAYSKRYQKELDATRLLARPCTPAMHRYIQLHEQTIAGDAPFAQVAIELEIEGLSVLLGPRLLEQFRVVLGQEILDCLTFLQEHVQLDVGHTALNRKMLGYLLEERPGAVSHLVETGTAALAAYLDFLGECLSRAEEGLSSTS